MADPTPILHRWRSRRDFESFWESPEYAPLRELRHEACRCGSRSDIGVRFEQSKCLAASRACWQPALVSPATRAPGSEQSIISYGSLRSMRYRSSASASLVSEASDDITAHRSAGLGRDCIAERPADLTRRSAMWAPGHSSDPREDFEDESADNRDDLS